MSISSNPSKKMIKVICVVAVRPNFIKVAPLLQEFKKYSRFEVSLVHTGQHYDQNMSDVFLADLEMPKPDVHLGIGSGSHAEITGKVMEAFEQVVLKKRPDLVIVVGDVDSTLATTITAAKCMIPVAHVEAGLRSYDRTMPEEINRVLTDSLSQFCFTPSEDAEENLKNEGVDSGKIHFVGNIMIDSLVRFRKKAEETRILAETGLQSRNYVLLTMHRPANVDETERLESILNAVKEIASEIPVVFPIHPRTSKNLKRLKIWDLLKHENIKCMEPIRYLEFLQLTQHAGLVLTDSGGIQEETTFLGIPCLTLREGTERPITVQEGTNQIVGHNTDTIVKKAKEILSGRIKQGGVPKYWDGHTAGRILKVIQNHF